MHRCARGLVAGALLGAVIVACSGGDAIIELGDGGLVSPITNDSGGGTVTTPPAPKRDASVAPPIAVDASSPDLDSGRSPDADASSPIDAGPVDAADAAAACSALNEACGSGCCRGLSCRSGICRTVVSCTMGGRFCTRQTASQCCSGRCDGDSCLADLGGPCDPNLHSGCPGGSSCRDGICKCDANEIACGNNCVDTSTDRFNCGRCGNACGADKTCVGGNCQCAAAGATDCGTYCATTTNDPNNCGQCGRACAAPLVECRDSTCQCPIGQTECNGACVSTTSNNLHCGRCGNACAADRTCSGTTCVCNPGLTECVPGTCTDLMTDRNNCRTCGVPCQGQKQCVGGVCQP